MTTGIAALSVTAASLGIIHTLSGPDHYLPFIVMSEARKWTKRKTVLITVLCGLGHVGSSILIGIAGIVFGLGVSRLGFLEGIRGNVAGWLFIFFGFGYMVWGMIREMRHIKAHEQGKEHTHSGTGLHRHTNDKPVNITPWILFTIFFFGPCEPLIPLLMYPAAEYGLAATVTVALIFSLSTILTMVTAVILASSGLFFIKGGFLRNYMHSIAGATILLCGISIQFLGL